MPGYHDPVHYQRRFSSFSLNAIEEYFAQLNPIAKRIAFDINGTKANYGQLWNTLDYQEQNDIINDSLIKPEISLRYFDSFVTPTPTNSSGHSYQSSTDSLTAIVLKDVNAFRNAGEQGDDGRKNVLVKPYCVKLNTHGSKYIYSYDGRNLYTFGMQKVALKDIQDEALGCFRDEHSRPFCYRTKSQINLFVLPPIVEPKAASKPENNCKKNLVNRETSALKNFEPSKSGGDESRKVLDNYHRLQHQLKINLQEIKSPELRYTSKCCSSVKPSSITTSQQNFKSPDMSYKLEKEKSLSVSKNVKSSMLQNYICSRQLNALPKIGMNYAVFSDVYNPAEESSNLLQHCSQSDVTTGSCSSAATSDDDDKTLEEDVHLLDNDSNIRKGFDFLNNW